MMRIYSVFTPQDAVSGDDLEVAERFHFVRHGVSFLALLAPIVWMVLRKLWLVLLLYILSMVAIGVLAMVVSPLFVVGVNVALALILFFEAGTILLASARMKGYQEVAVIEAANQGEAERKFFQVWLAKRNGSSRGTQPSPQSTSGAPALPRQRLMRPASTMPPPLPGFGR